MVPSVSVIEKSIGEISDRAFENIEYIQQMGFCEEHSKGSWFRDRHNNNNNS